MVARYLLALGIICASGAYAVLIRAHRAAPEGVAALATPPAQVGDWVSDGCERVTGASAPEGSTTFRCRYRRADASSADLSIVYYGQQDVNSQIHSPQNCIPGGGWKIDWIRKADVDIGGTSVPATAMRVRKGGRALDVYYWFRTRSGAVSGEYALKWDLVKNSLLNRPTNAAMIRFMADTSDSTAMRELMCLLGPGLDGLLEGVGL